MLGNAASVLEAATRRLLRADLAGAALEAWESAQWNCKALEEAANDLGAGPPCFLSQCSEDLVCDAPAPGALHGSAWLMHAACTAHAWNKGQWVLCVEWRAK